MKFAWLIIIIFLQSCFLFNDEPSGPIEPPDNKISNFNATPDQYTIKTNQLQEASGIAYSRNIVNKCWVENDGGNLPSIHLISAQGIYEGKIDLPVRNRDWEDLACGPGPIAGTNYIYIADTGDNQEIEKSYSIYRLQEPFSLNQNPNVDEINFVYEDGKSYDTETIFVDPKTKDLYLVTKRQLNVKVFRLIYPYYTQGQNIAKFEGSIQVPFVVGGDISPDGSEILLKSLTTIFYWKRKSGESIIDALKRDNDLICPYQREKQGEAICFDNEASSYLTIGELSGNENLLYRYYKIKNN